VSRARLPTLQDYKTFIKKFNKLRGLNFEIKLRVARNDINFTLTPIIPQSDVRKNPKISGTKHNV